ncbi:hypothetical protein [Marinobacter halophilus]|uniref:Uncharacterized protein n=1 Tax=Marinobacter halophilus TaxID=1323740 RepID=A0A2T1KCW4_9GAMM|nr:hypothetical protein [Marinobacter halophilus]PSF07979.1 hypothetical protein C7H08_11320 [Marinobacter halophilus]GGC58741.1 hypothetical protein GCM10011362_03930 [Marinobacter halophilus]
MDTGQLWNLLALDNLPLLLAAAALLFALIAILLSMGARSRHQEQIVTLRERADWLCREVDDVRVVQFNRASEPGTPTQGSSALDEARYRAEKDAYDKIWPQVWHLYERLGMFLRAVEAGEAAGELRLDARHAALEARSLLNRNRPFCSEVIEGLTTRLIDTEIKAHLAACQHLDLLKDVSNDSSSHDRRVLQDKCHSLHEGDARDLINQLASSIRQRTIRIS